MDQWLSICLVCIRPWGQFSLLPKINNNNKKQITHSFLRLYYISQESFLDKFQLHIGTKLFFILTLILFLHLPFPFLPSVSCGPSWSWVYYVVKDNLDLQIPLLPPHCWGYLCVPQQACIPHSGCQASALSAQLHPWPFLPVLLSLLIGDPLYCQGWPGTELVGSDGLPAPGSRVPGKHECATAFSFTVI